MALKDRFRKAIGRPTGERTSSSSDNSRTGTGTTTPIQSNGTPLTATSTNTDNTPTITLTKTATLSKPHTRPYLAKTLSWHASNKPSRKEAKARKELEEWAKKDAIEWTSPMSSRPGRKDQKCQDTLRAFDLKKFERESMDAGRNKSIDSGISPSASRTNSVADGDANAVLQNGRKRSSGAGAVSGLSHEVSQGKVEFEDGEQAVNGTSNVKKVDTVREE